MLMFDCNVSIFQYIYKLYVFCKKCFYEMGKGCLFVEGVKLGEGGGGGGVWGGGGGGGFYLSICHALESRCVLYTGFRHLG